MVVGHDGPKEVLVWEQLSTNAFLLRPIDLKKLQENSKDVDAAIVLNGCPIKACLDDFVICVDTSLSQTERETQLSYENYCLKKSSAATKAFAKVRLLAVN